MADRVLAKVVKAASLGDMKAARLYFDVMGNYGNQSSINTTINTQNNYIQINQTKLSGQCGRLKCCLNYELDTYLDALQHFPDNAEMLQTVKGTASLIKKDIFRNLMWYIMPGSTKHYPLTIQRVKEIQRLNARG